ncbi:MAG: hypothetical protein LBQ41_03175 [Candidatus Ancillula sp.]|jgi:hypothetical protein|nr:hypothetical protein [Candidatus Ancillula sp.]
MTQERFFTRSNKAVCGICAAVCILLTLTLSSCIDYSAKDTEKVESNSNVLPSLKVEFDGKNEPKVEYDATATIPVEVIDENADVARNVSKVVSHGEGTIQNGQTVALEYLYYSMPGFSKQFSTWDEGAKVQKLTVNKDDQDSNSLSKLLLGLGKGAIVAVATPGFDMQTQKLDLSGTNYTVQILIVDDFKNPTTKAEGTPVDDASLDPKLPKVTLATDGTPSIKIPSSFIMPSSSVSEQLKKGAGPKLDKVSNISFAYSAFDADTSELIQSTWDTKIPLTATLGQTNMAWQTALEHASVGDQYLIIVPKGGENSTSKDLNLIFVVDVLDEI